MNILITGASSGIGKSIADVYNQEGNHLYLVARRKELLEQNTKDFVAKVTILAEDLSDSKATQKIAKVIGGNVLDCLINNAGIQRLGSLENTSGAHLEKITRVNFITPIELSAQLLPALRRSNKAVICNIASVGAFNPLPYMAIYSGTKGGLATWSEGMRAELRKEGVHVLTVFPGPIRTPMEARVLEMYEQSKMQNAVPFGTPDALAKKIKKAILKQDSRLVYPAVYSVARTFQDFATWVSGKFAPAPKES